MYMSGMRDKCLNILHLYQDNLWSINEISKEYTKIAKFLVKYGQHQLTKVHLVN